MLRPNLDCFFLQPAYYHIQLLNFMVSEVMRAYHAPGGTLDSGGYNMVPVLEKSTDLQRPKDKPIPRNG